MFQNNSEENGKRNLKTNIENIMDSKQEETLRDVNLMFIGPCIIVITEE